MCSRSVELLAVAAAADRAEAEAAEARAQPCCQSTLLDGALTGLLVLAVVFVVAGAVMMLGGGVMIGVAWIPIGSGVLLLIVRMVTFFLCLGIRGGSCRQTSSN